jgi:hypothetical protein
VQSLSNLHPAQLGVEDALAPCTLHRSEATYVHLRLVDGRPELRGQATCRFGHQIERPGAERPDGIFAEWSWDGRRLVARNDRYGIQPLHYFVRDGEIALSPSLATLVQLGAPRALDEVALAVFMRVGCFLGEDTPLAAVRRLPPDARLVWQDGRLSLDGRLPPRAEPANLSRRAAVDGMIDLFRQAIRRRTVDDDDFTVALSGGEDSRHVMLELCTSGRRPRFCVILAPWWGQAAQDLPIASRLARALGVERVVVRVPGARLPLELRKNRQLSFGSRRHAQFLPLARFFHGRVSAVYEGLAGGWVRNNMLRRHRLAAWRAGHLEAMARELLAGRVDPHRFLAREVRGRFAFDRALEALVANMRQHAEAPDPIITFAFWAMERENALVPHGLYSGVPKVFAPYLDHELFDFLASIPAELKLDHRLHGEAIRRAYPRYAEIPFARWQLTPAQPWYTRRFCLEALRYLARRPSRLVDRGRAARGLLDGLRRGQTPLDVRMLVYLLQLERFLDN